MYTISFSKEKRVQPVMKEGALQMLALSLSKGEALTKHATPNILYLQCVQGSAKIELYDPDKTLMLKPQQMIRIDPKHEHAVYADDSDVLLQLHLIKPE